jgi:hypothetical protein
MKEDVQITVDTSQVAKLPHEIHAAAEVGLRRVAERGEQLLRKHAPKVTHNLEQGVSSDVDASAMEATLVVAARAGRRGARSATLHLASGMTRQIQLRPQPAFDYAEAVARGRKAKTPTRAKVLLIPVADVPAGSSYVESEGQKFILRPRAKATKPSDFDVKAFNDLDREAQPIFDRALRDFGVLQ